MRASLIVALSAVFYGQLSPAQPVLTCSDAAKDYEVVVQKTRANRLRPSFVHATVTYKGAVEKAGRVVPFDDSNAYGYRQADLSISVWHIQLADMIFPYARGEVTYTRTSGEVMRGSVVCNTRP